VRKVAQENNCDCEIEKVTDITKIMSAGVMMTPAIVVDGKVVLCGKLPTENELKKLIIPN
ncbi:MAG: thioredoxin family protein, partial [bacterium]